MGIPLFGVNISGIVKDTMGSGNNLPVVKLLSKTNGTRTVGALTAGTNPKSKSSTAKGFVAEFEEKHINGTTILRGDRMVVIIGDTLPKGTVPEPGDEIFAENSTFKIVEDGVKRDPAAATYTCHVRNR